MAEGRELVMRPMNFELRPILLRWEKLRLVYNFVLSGVALVGLALRPELLRVPTLPLFLIACCIGANVCFCAGPAVEAYINFRLNRRVMATWFLFFPGMAMSIPAAFIAMMVWRAAEW